jgi:uncharacterized membrane protein YfcA
MSSPVPIPELITLALALAVTGLAAGLLAGIFGIGGGAVIVPILYQALGALGFPEATNMQIALGTSLAVIIPTSLRSFQAHRARGVVDMGLLRSWTIPVPVGVLLGALVAGLVSGAALRGIFAALAFLVALKLIFNRASWRLAGDLPGGSVRTLVGGAVGFLSALMGIGGGVMSNTFMTLFGRPIHQAVATAAGVGILIAVPGTIGYMGAGLGATGLPPLSVGYVNLLGVAVITPLSLLMAPLGVRIAHALSKRQLETGFGFFLLMISARFAYSLL